MVPFSPGWYALQLATACITRNTEMISMLAAQLTSEFNCREIKKIWKQARLALMREEASWLQEQLHLLLKYL